MLFPILGGESKREDAIKGYLLYALRKFIKTEICERQYIFGIDKLRTVEFDFVEGDNDRLLQLTISMDYSKPNKAYEGIFYFQGSKLDRVNCLPPSIFSGLTESLKAYLQLEGYAYVRQISELQIKDVRQLTGTSLSEKQEVLLFEVLCDRIPRYFMYLYGVHLCQEIPSKLFTDYVYGA
jgi:hypothetical protein